MHWTHFATLAGILSVIAAIALFQGVRSMLRRGHRQNDLYSGAKSILPGFRIVSTRHNMLHLHDIINRRDFKIDLRPLWAQLRAAGSEPRVRRYTIECWLFDLRKALKDPPPQPEAADTKVLARVVNAAMLARMSAPTGVSVPARALGSTGLFAVLVQDVGESVRYLNSQAIGETRLSFDDLMNRALHGLQQAPNVLSAVRDAIAADSVTTLKTGDSYDAARLLLLPKLLADGQRIVTLVPDPHTLLISPMPGPEGWERLHALAEMHHGEDRLLANPIVVDRQGFTLVTPQRD